MAISMSRTFGLGALVSAAFAAFACSTQVASDGGTDSNTHWLDQCSDDADCGDLRCMCGLCTRPCRGSDSCSEFGRSASCEDAVVGCEVAAGERVCVAPCEGSSDCPPGLQCDAGQCTPRPASDGGTSPSPDGGGRVPDAGDPPPDGNNPPPPDAGDVCVPMDARSGNARCARLLGFTWDGEGCNEVQCECAGSDCGRLYTTSEACAAAHRHCLPPPDSGAVAGPDVCSLPLDSGPCFGAGIAYGYFPGSASCVPFTYGLCGGNANNFPSLDACQVACGHRADRCDTCPDGQCGSGPDLPPNCATCPVERRSSGEACSVKNLECTFYPSCGATTCRCTDDASGGLAWDCLDNLC